ncbi:MAG TPA: DUF167 domain-containing protein [Kofleriaceae bacterium]|nr:DUF167 domain-containing protein [Kofleriaceae bacterium]
MNLRSDGGDLLIDVLVQPRASRPRIGPVREDRLVVAVSAPPVDGAANRAVVEAVARALDLGRTQVEVVRGDTSRRKTLRLRGATRAAVEALVR